MDPLPDIEPFVGDNIPLAMDSVRLARVLLMWLHPKGFRSAKRDIWVKGESLTIMEEPESREPACQSLERDLCLEPAERGTKTIVDSPAEGEGPRRVRASQIKRLGLREDGCVATGCGQPEEQFRTLG